MLLRRARRRAARRRRAPLRRRRGLHGRLLHREDGLLGLRLLHEELLLLHGDHHLLPARERPSTFAANRQINSPTEGPELLAIRHFELRAPDGTLTDKMAALERALDLQVNGFN